MVLVFSLSEFLSLGGFLCSILINHNILKIYPSSKVKTKFLEYGKTLSKDHVLDKIHG